MTFFFRRLFLLLTLCTLLVACGPQGSNGTKDGAAIPAGPKSVSNTAIDTCPKEFTNYKGCLTPRALRLAYGVDQLIQKGFTGKGQTIIDIVSFGSPTLQQDMDIFDNQFGLPPTDLQIISPLTVPEYDPHNDKAGWADETTLDVQIIHAIAPAAKIVVLVSPVAETEGTIGLPEFRQLEQYVLDHKLGNIVSQSWGASELTLQDKAGQQELQKWNDFYQKATTQQGMTYLLFLR